MMLITAVVPASSVLPIRRALALFDVYRYAVAPVYRTGSGAPAMRFEVVAPNIDTADLVRIITRAATAGRPVTIWVTRIVEMYDIHTGQRGLDAL
jgi:hypothetical protein